MGQLMFDSATHTYTVDGVTMDCVSDVIGIYGEDIDNEDIELAIERAADRGVTCHAVIEEMLNGNTEPEYPSCYSAYVDAISLFLDEHRIVPLAIETPVYGSTIDLAGTPDLLCEFDGELAILDYKFVSQVAKAKVKAQLNAYRLIYEEQGVYVDKLFAVQFLPDGTYRLYPVAVDDTEINVALQVRGIKRRKFARGKIN